MATSSGADEDGVVGICGNVVNLVVLDGTLEKRSTGHTTKELSSESVYQQNLAKWNGLSAKSGRNMDTKFRMASMAGSGRLELSEAGRGIDHFPSWENGAFSGAG